MLPFQLKPSCRYLFYRINQKADFVLVFVFVLLGIIALTAALINDLLPFHRTRAQQIAVVEDVHVEIKEHLIKSIKQEIIEKELRYINLLYPFQVLSTLFLQNSLQVSS